MDPIPPDAFLAAYSRGIRERANQLRAIVRRAVPDAIERVRPGWRLIGYEVPVGRRTKSFAWVAPEAGHVHLGFEYGIAMADPDRMLQGAHLRLRKVRYLTFTPGQPIPHSVLVDFTPEAARLAAMSAGERLALMLDRESAPDPRRSR